MEVLPEEVAAEEAAVSEAAPSWPSADTVDEITVEAEPEVAEFAVVEETKSGAVGEEPAASAEIDLSSEWNDTVTVEEDAPAISAAVEEAAVPDESGTATGGDGVPEGENTDETIEEIRFYLAHGMPEQAMAALAKLQTLTRDEEKLSAMRTEVEAATQAALEEAQVEEHVVADLAVEDIPSAEVVAEEEVEPAPVEEGAAVEPRVEQIEEAPVAALAAPESEPGPAAKAEPGMLEEFVSDLESSLGDSFMPGAVAKPVASPVATQHFEPAELAPTASRHAGPTIAAQRGPVLGEFVADIEASLGEDFLKTAPMPAPTASVTKTQPTLPVPVAAPPTPKIAAPMASSAAASSASAATSHTATVVGPTVPIAPAASRPGPAVEAPKPQS